MNNRTLLLLASLATLTVSAFAQKPADALPTEHLLVALDAIEDDPDHRRITIVANGVWT